MFTPEFFIDVIQSTKKSIFNRIVTDPRLQRISDRFIDSQTEFAKIIVANIVDLAKYSLDNSCPKKEERAAAPYKVESPTEKAANTDRQGENDVKQ
jgi:hypothetical protein